MCANIKVNRFSGTLLMLSIGLMLSVVTLAAPTTTDNVGTIKTTLFTRRNSNNNNSSTSTTYTYISANTTTKFNLKWTPRFIWQAAPARHITSINGGMAVSHVIIHHTATPAAACQRNSSSRSRSSNEGNNNNLGIITCRAAVRAIQRSHQKDHGWDDIGYNFLIGGNAEHAEIYEGRGFNVTGAHAPGYNGRSVGVALIGDWSDALPPRSMLDKLKQLITFGTHQGYIQSNYTLLGHRQVKATACPGTKLFNEIKQWPHFGEK